MAPQRFRILPFQLLPGAALGLAALVAAAGANAQGVSTSVALNPDPVRPGESLEIQITVVNDGVSDRDDVAVEFTLPPGLASLDELAMTEGASCVPSVSNNGLCDPLERVSWTIDALPAGTGRTFRLPPLVAAGTAAGTVLTVEAEIFDDGAEVASDTKMAVVAADRKLDLELMESADPVAPGETITWTLSFGHRGTSSLAPSTVLSLVLPPEVSFVSATGGGAHAAGTVTWALGTLQPGQIGVRQVTATVGAGLGEGDLLAARASILDTAPANEARARTVTRVRSEMPLQLQLVAAPDPVEPGETQDVELVVSNRGAFPLFDAILELVVPDEVADFAEEVASGAPACVVGVTNNGLCDARERLVWSLDDLAPGAGRSFRLPPQIVAGLADGTIVSWRAVAEALDGGALASVEAGAATIVQEARRLDLGLVESLDPVGAGESLGYAVSFGHLATSSLAPGATLELLLPPGVTGVSASDGGTLEPGGLVRWTLGDLQPGQSGVRNVRVTVPGATPEAALLGAQARIADTASFPNEARTRAVTRVRSESPLRLELAATPDPVRPGETQDVELVLSNRGAFPIFDAAVELVVPDEIADFAEELANGAPACAVGVTNNALCDARERLVWEVGQIAPGTGRTLRVSPQLLGGIANGTLVGWRAAAEALDDGVTEFAEAGAFPIVQASPRFDLAVVESADPIGGAQLLTYEIHFGHRGSPGLAPGSRLEIVLPPGTVFRSATKGGVHAGGTVNWWLGPMVPGAAGVRRVTVSAPGGPPAQAALLPARVRVWDGSSLASESRARSVTRVRSGAPVALSVAFPSGPIEQGQVLTAKLTVTNRTVSTLFDVDVEAVVPDGMQSFSPLQTDGGTCIVAVSNNGLCDPRERIAWTIPQISAGASVELDLQFTVVSGPSELADGNVLALQALVDGGDEQAGGFAVKPIPEPSAWWATLAALGALCARASRRRSRAVA